MVWYGVHISVSVIWSSWGQDVDMVVAEVHNTMPTLGPEVDTCGLHWAN